MTEVRIRHWSDVPSAAASLGDVPFGDLGSVIEFISYWGMCDRDGSVDVSTLSATFRRDGDGGFFDVVYGDE